MSPWQELFHAISMREPSSTMPGSLALDDASSRHSVVLDQSHTPSVDQATPLSPTVDESSVVEEAAPKAIPTPHDKSSKPCSETLVIVQPNPKMQQHHPFNLQVQLVSPKHARSESSVASMSTRRIIALYNFDYHQIRPKIVSDAGTDQMVAKFTRRTVEMAGFAILQPREIMVHPPGATHGLGALDSESEAWDHGHDSVIEEDAMSSRSGKGLMKRIKRFGAHLRTRNGNPASHARSTQDLHDLTPTIKQFLRAPFVPDPATEYESAQTEGIQPNSSEAHALHRAISRAILTRIFEHFGASSHPTAISDEQHPYRIPMWFEWVREWNGGLDNPANLYDPAVHGSLEPPSTHPRESVESRSAPMETPQLPDTEGSFSEWRSQDSHGLNSHRPCLSKRDTSPPSRVPGSESDNPVLRPWTCSIVLDGTTRIPIGRLIPAPQHPLVVCELMLPSPLPDLRYSALGADGGGFSREELRDIVSVTAIHLVTRESMVLHTNLGYPK
ncbi:hypothetical protein MEQU1_000300 [Malassezia equina]|uniref:Uncharacterized protein n=1 Tax=Malassezia equina TaxID=1381935 RepID=A0AAF0E9U7_9BASI|nr:hypothetical protein MEQU1_000300 [Malassezia equina]